MTSYQVPIQSAATFLEALNAYETLSFYLDNLDDEALVDGGITPDLEHKLREVIAKAQLLADAMWIPVDESATAQIVEEAGRHRPLTIRKVAAKFKAFTPGLPALARTRATPRVDHKTNLHYERPLPVPPQELLWEGAIDWLVRMADGRPWLRRCIWCNEWFELERKTKRFCKDEHRDYFNNLKRSGRDQITQFDCQKCHRKREAGEFSGLIFSSAEALTMGSYMGSYGPVYAAQALDRRTSAGADHYGGIAVREQHKCCVDCVQAYYPEWSRYIGLEPHRPTITPILRTIAIEESQK